MEKKKIIEKTIKRLNLLPDSKVMEIDSFIEKLLKEYQEELNTTKGIQNLTQDSKTFEFLENEEDLYSLIKSLHIGIQKVEHS